MKMKMAVGVATALACMLALARNAAATPAIGSSESFLGQNGAFTFTVQDASGPRNCNEVSFAPIPGDPIHVLGRYNNGCTSTTWSLALYTVDFIAHTLTVANLAFDTSGGNVPVCGSNGAQGGNSISTAYDASVMSYGGELWVAFECGGSIAGAATASACVGPMNASTGAIDPTRTNVAVLGNNSIGDGYYYSASVPKLLAFQGNAYVYWTAVQINQADTSQWASITERGMQLAEYPSTGGLLWSAGIAVGVGAKDPNYTTEVWGLGTSSTTNMVADVSGIFTDGTSIFATAGIAGSACGGGQTPFWPPSCYAIAMSKSTSALANDMFNSGVALPSSELTTETGSYVRYFDSPSGLGYLMGCYYTNVSGKNPLPISSPTSNVGYVVGYPIPPDAPYFAGMSVATDTITGPVGVNQSGALEAFAIDRGSHSLEHLWQTGPAAGWVSGWSEFTGFTADQTAVAVMNSNGDLGASTHDLALHQIDDAQQAAPDEGWSGWSHPAGAVGGAGSPTIGLDADSRLELFFVGYDGNLYDAWQSTPGGSLGAWASLGSPSGGIVGSPTVATNEDGRLEVFVRIGDGSVWHVWQGSPGGGWVSSWASLGGNTPDTLGVERNVTGTLELFAIGSDGALWHIWQTSAGGNWSAWASLGGSVTGRPAVGKNASGTLEAFVRGVDGAIYHIWQTSPAAGWSAVSSLGAPNGLPGQGSPVVQKNVDGRLETFFVGNDSQLWHIWQTIPGASWSSWAALGGSVEPFYAEGVSPPKAPAGDGGASGTPDGGTARPPSQGGLTGDASASGSGNGANAGSDGSGASSTACSCRFGKSTPNGAALLLAVGLLSVIAAARYRASRARCR
jgi:hypothetical protein